MSLGNDSMSNVFELLNRLIFDTQGASQQDKVWQLTAQPGRQIAYIPFRVSNVNRINSLSRFPITVRTGRFIGFAIPAPKNDAGHSNDLNFDEVIAANPDKVAEIQGGNEKLLNFLTGQVMKASKGKANPKMVTEGLRGKLLS